MKERQLDALKSYLQQGELRALLDTILLPGKGCEDLMRARLACHIPELRTILDARLAQLFSRSFSEASTSCENVASPNGHSRSWLALIIDWQECRLGIASGDLSEIESKMAQLVDSIDPKCPPDWFLDMVVAARQYPLALHGKVAAKAIGTYLAAIVPHVLRGR